MNAETLKSLVRYDASTGLFTRLATGAPIVSKNGAGYVQVWLRPKMYYGHRLAWLYVYGEMPAGHIDHANGDRSDNRICNLRLCNDTQNHGNSKVRRSGLKGVWFNSRRKTWHALIQHRKQKHYLGCFSSEEAAHDAYMAKAEQLFGEFARAA